MARPSRGILSNAALIGSATMASRITGFMRDIFLAALMGAGHWRRFCHCVSPAQFVSPSICRRAFNAAFVPLFSERWRKKGKRGVGFCRTDIFRFVGRFGSVYTFGGNFHARLVLALAQGFAGDDEKFALAVHYARLSFPYLIFMSLMALFAAMLNAVNRFFAAALAPVLLNLVLIAAMALAVLKGVPMGDERLLDYVIYAVVLAGLAQFLFVFIAARRAALRVTLSRPVLSDDVEKVWRLAVPGILAAGIGQINLLVGTSIATGQAGAAAWLYYADRLYQLPMGVIGVALSVALLPELARHLAKGETARAKGTQDMAVLAAAGLTLPAAVGLAVLAGPIVSLLFERGAFSATDSAITAQLIIVFSFGLPAFVLVKALQPSFFARQDTRAPLIDGAIGVGFNIALSLALFPSYGAPAIAFATVMAGWVTLTLMLWRMARRDIYHLSWPLLRRVAAQVLAAGLMGWALYQAMGLMPPDILSDSVSGLAAWLAVFIAAGALVYGLAAVALGGLRRADIGLLRGSQ